jgi:hypothetical protein
MATFRCSTFFAMLEMLSPARKGNSFGMMDTGMFSRNKNGQIFGPIIQRVIVPVMDDTPIRQRSKSFFGDAAMFENPTGRSESNLTKGVTVSSFAFPDGQRSDCFSFPRFFRSEGTSTFRRTGRSAQRSIAFKALPTNRATSEVLSHATE